MRVRKQNVNCARNTVMRHSCPSTQHYSHYLRHGRANFRYFCSVGKGGGWPNDEAEALLDSMGRADAESLAESLVDDDKDDDDDEVTTRETSPDDLGWKDEANAPPPPTCREATIHHSRQMETLIVVLCRNRRSNQTRSLLCLCRQR